MWTLRKLTLTKHDIAITNRIDTETKPEGRNVTSPIILTKKKVIVTRTTLVNVAEMTIIGMMATIIVVVGRIDIVQRYRIFRHLKVTVILMILVYVVE